jgi:retron-type reverse transcriptase
VGRTQPRSRVYGYRPNKSVIQAIEVTRTRGWRKDWVLEFDIKCLFDNIRHDYLIEMVKHHTKEKWILLYVQRWLTALFQMEDGTNKRLLMIHILQFSFSDVDVFFKIYIGTG